MIELEHEIVEREVAFTDDWYMVRKMDRTPTFAEAIHWADTHPNWIKVEDRLPEKNLTPALVFLKDGRYCIAWWFITDRGCKWVDYFDSIEEEYTPLWGNVTHWLPIILPKED